MVSPCLSANITSVLDGSMPQDQVYTYRVGSYWKTIGSLFNSHTISKYCLSDFLKLFLFWFLFLDNSRHASPKTCLPIFTNKCLLISLWQLKESAGFALLSNVSKHQPPVFYLPVSLKSLLFCLRKAALFFTKLCPTPSSSLANVMAADNRS